MFLSVFDSFYSQAVIPKLYWEAVSQEQRLQWMAKECQALEDYARQLRDEQEAINESVDARLTNLESRVTALEKRVTEDEQAFEDYKALVAAQFQAVWKQVNLKANAADVYTKVEADKRFMRLEDTMAWQGWFQGDYCYTLPRDCVAGEAYVTHPVETTTGKENQ